MPRNFGVTAKLVEGRRRAGMSRTEPQESIREWRNHLLPTLPRSPVLPDCESSMRVRRRMKGWDTPGCLGCWRPLLPNCFVNKMAHRSQHANTNTRGLFGSLPRNPSQAQYREPAHPRGPARCREGLCKRRNHLRPKPNPGVNWTLSGANI